jgi:hypothetical protein
MYISIVIILFIAFLISFFVFLSYQKKRKFSKKDNEYIVKKWFEIEKDKNFKNAIIEADKLLDYSLKKKGYFGSLGEKLKKADSLFSNANNIWNAHKLRNKLVHEMDAGISEYEAKKAINSFKHALKDIGIIL